MSFVLSPRRQILRSIYAIVGRSAPEEADSKSLEHVTGNSRINVASNAAALEATGIEPDQPTEQSSDSDTEISEDEDHMAAREQIESENPVYSSIENVNSDSESFVDALEPSGLPNAHESFTDHKYAAISPVMPSITEPARKKRRLAGKLDSPPLLQSGSNNATAESYVNLQSPDFAPTLCPSSPRGGVQSSPSASSQLLSPTPRRQHSSLGFPAGRLAVFEFNFEELEPLGTTLDQEHLITASTDQNAVSLWVNTANTESFDDSVRITSFLLNEEPVILVKSVEEILSLIRGQDLGAHSVVKVRRLAAESPLVLKVPATSSLAKTVVKRRLLHPSNIQQYQLQCIKLADVASFIEAILRAEGVSILFT